MKLIFVLGLADGRATSWDEQGVPRKVSPPVDKEGLTNRYELVGVVGNEAYYIPEFTTAAQAIKQLVERG